LGRDRRATHHEDHLYAAVIVGGHRTEQTGEGIDAAKRDGVEHTIEKMDGTVGRWSRLAQWGV
jgi:hypothetical protein